MQFPYSMVHSVRFDQNHHLGASWAYAKFLGACLKALNHFFLRNPLVKGLAGHFQNVSPSPQEA
jgi:hypothetical protein